MTAAGLAHLLFPAWTAQRTTWQTEVHWQREIAYFDLLLACAFLRGAKQNDGALKPRAAR